MRISTKTGDKGETSLLGGERVRKHDARIEAYGDVDELNAMIGVSLSFAENPAIREVLSQVQHDLFTIGAELASLTSKPLEVEIPRITAEHLEFLNKTVETAEGALPEQKSFILPSGTPSASHLHLARTMCRRAERHVAALNNEMNPLIIKYLNRLSDVIYLFARAENHGKVEEKKVEYSS